MAPEIVMNLRKMEQVKIKCMHIIKTVRVTYSPARMIGKTCSRNARGLGRLAKESIVVGRDVDVVVVCYGTRDIQGIRNGGMWGKKVRGCNRNASRRSEQLRGL